MAPRQPAPSKPAKKKADPQLFGAPTPGNPFGFRTPLPARKTKPLIERAPSSVPNLTDRVTVARTEKSKQANAGLASAAQLEAERKAQARIDAETARRAAASHAGVAKTAANRTPVPARASAAADTKPTAPVNPRAGMAAATARSQGGGIDWGALLGGVRKGVGVALDPASLAPALPGSAGDVQGYLNTTHRFMFPNPLELIGTAASGRMQREAAGAQRAQAGIQSAVDKLRPSAGVIPGHASVAVADLTPAAKKALQAQGISGQVSLKDLIAQYGEGALGPAYRKKLIEGAVTKQGWPNHDTNTWTDADAAARYFNPYKHTALGFFQNAAADIGALAAGANAIPMVAAPAIEAAKGNVQPLARTGAGFFDQWRKHLAFVGDRPLLENLYSEPFTTATSNVPIAKMAGVRFGKLAGLKPTREVTLPTTGAVRTIPATQNALTRPLTRLSDAVLAKGAAREPRTGGPRGIPQHVETAITTPVHALGRRMERRQVGAAQRLESNQVKLETSAGSSRAQRDLLKAIQGLPTIGRDWVPGKMSRVVESGQATARISDKQRRAESIIAHARLGFDSGRVATYFDEQAQRSHADAQSQLALAREEHLKAREAQANGAVSAPYEDAALRHETAARQHELDAKNQTLQAEYSRANPVSLADLGPKEHRLVEAARKVSQESTRLNLKSGKLGEQGALFGDLQHNLELTLRLEPNTPAGQLASQVMQHRETMRALEAKMPEGQLSDRRSPAAQQVLGRVRELSRTLKDVQQRRGAVAQRLARTQETAARRTQEGPAVAPATQRRIIDEGRSALTAKRQGRQAIAAEARRAADEITAGELAAHQKVHNAALQKTRRDLRSAQYRTNSPTASIAREAQREVERLTFRQSAEQAALDNFVPTERVTKAQARADRLEAKAASTTLAAGELSSIARKHLGVEARSINKSELYAATHEGVFQGADAELARLEARHQAALHEADARYTALAGSRSEAALRHEQEAQAFQQRMQEFKALRESQGIQPFHSPLGLPGSKRGAAPVKQSERLQFPTGNYTNDIHIQLAANLEGLTRKAVSEELFKRAAQGPYVITDAPPLSEIPPGYTLTDAELLSTKRREVVDAAGNKAYEDLAGAWAREADQPQRYVPDDGKKYALVAKDAQDWFTHELSMKGSFGEQFMPLQGLLAFTNAYRRWMLFTLPRTLVNNAVGNPILAAMGGAGIMDYMRAIHILRNHPDQIPHLLLGRGPVYNALEARKITGYQSTLRDANVFHEDLGRLTLYVHHAIRYARKEQGLKFYQRVSLANEKMTGLLKDLAEGRDPNVHQFMDFANQWFGDMAKRGKWDPILSSAVLFHRWVGHMVKLTLWTMPTKYPGRTALLLNLSHMADAYRKEHGLWPDWARSIVGLVKRVETVAGKPQEVIWGVNTGGAAPFATPGQTLDFGSTANPKIPLASIAAANLNPALRILFEQASGKRLDTWQDFKDQYGNATGAGDWRVLVNSLIGNTPVLSTVFPRTGLADTSIQVLPNAPRRYSAAGAIDPAYYPPRPTGHGFWMDFVIRALAAGGVSLRPVDSKGPRTALTAEKTVAYQAQAAKQRASRQEKVDLGKQLAENRKRWATQRP